MNQYYKLSLRERFDRLFMPEPNTGCWLWTGRINQDGYGIFGDSGTGAHRASFQLFKGEIPKGLLVCHHCDVRSCVNPDHLFLGTHRDNMDDMMRKRIISKKKVKVRINNRSSEDCNLTKLTAEMVTEIRNLHSKGVTSRKIGEIFSVTHSNVRYIVNRKTWKHL